MNSLVKNLLPLITFLLIIFNIYTLSQWGIIDSRWARIITVIILGIYLTKISLKENRILLGSFLLFLVCDFFILKYEINYAKYFYFAFHALAYLVLLFHIKLEIKRPNLNLLQTLYFIAMILINCFLLYKIASLFSEEIQEPGLVILFYLNGFITIALVMVAFLVWDKNGNRASIILFTGVLILVLSEVIMFSAYYIDIKEMYYLERSLYVIGLARLVRFSALYKNISTKKEKKLIS